MNQRLAALDWMRGLVMVIMVTDHASAAFNGERLVADSALFPKWSEPLDSVQFLFRWLSHLCAPVFVFLAGTSLALSLARRTERGASSLSLDRDLLVRGLIIIGVDLTFINMVWFPGGLLFQVMFAIGSSFILMVLFRRMPTWTLLACALAIWVLGEFSRSGNIGLESTPVWLARGVLLDGGRFMFEFTDELLMVAYPVLPWCAVMLLGFALGRWLNVEKDKRVIAKRLLWYGIGLMASFAAIRGFNGSFGNLGLTRLDNTVLRWLQVSKYPPSLSFVSLELGIMFLLLAAFFRLESAGKRDASRSNALLVFGQTAFFFYLAHIFLLETAARQLDLHRTGTLVHVLFASLVSLVLLYPVCLLYRRVKRAYPQSPLRYF